ncbi:glycoside hydrolase family 78 protein [Streptomyces sp. NBC_00487]
MPVVRGLTSRPRTGITSPHCAHSDSRRHDDRSQCHGRWNKCGGGKVRPQGGPVRGLTVEHRTDPLGVDADRPRFGWRSRTGTRGSGDRGCFRTAGSSTPTSPTTSYP